MRHLKEAGIGTAIHYPIPLHLQKAYISLNYSVGDFPVAESAAAEIISIPMFPQLTSEQLEKVCAEVKSFTAKPQQGPAKVELERLLTAERIG